MSEANKILVAVVMGSKSDWETMKAADEMLTKCGVNHVCRVLSAHRTPKELEQFISEMEKQGCEVYIAAAGGGAHLAGVVAAQTVGPVLGGPVESQSLKGLVLLLVLVVMPGGIPGGALALGEAGATNWAMR